MSKLDYAMEQQMAFIVMHESRPFCYIDFLRWDDGENEHEMTHGTFRNKVSKLVKSGEVELSYYSGCAFYTLKGHPFGKPMTPYPYGGLPFPLNHDDPLYKTLQHLPFGAESIHDIRLRFQAPDIYRTFTCLNFRPLNNFHCNEISGDIAIPFFFKDNAVVRIIIHKTDVVSVIIGCSKQPIPLDISGWSRFSSLLTRAEERLQSILDTYYRNRNLGQNYNYTACFPDATAVVSSSSSSSSLPPSAVVKIPDYLSWIITMWHFGRDALTEYNGSKFSRTVEDAQHILTRIYSKEYGNGTGRRKRTRIRAETQEYPNRTVSEVMEEELNQDV